MSQIVQHSEPATVPPAATVGRAGQIAVGLVRILLGWVYLWAFLDKLFGLGMATPAERAWVSGASATRGYLSGVEGPFAGLFTSMSGNAVVDWLFMLGMFAVGVAFVLGIALRLAAVGGLLLMGGIYLSQLPLEMNPFLDQHLMYIVLGAALALTNAGRFVGLGRWWAALPVIRSHAWLR